MRAVMLLSLACAGLFACSTTPEEPLTPFLSPEGSVGFSVSGIATFTSDRAAVEAVVRARLEEACGGEIEVLEMTLTDASRAAPHTHYRASAVCRSR